MLHLSIPLMRRRSNRTTGVHQVTKCHSNCHRNVISCLVSSAIQLLMAVSEHVSTRQVPLSIKSLEINSSSLRRERTIIYYKVKDHGLLQSVMRLTKNPADPRCSSWICVNNHYSFEAFFTDIHSHVISTDNPPLGVSFSG